MSWEYLAGFFDGEGCIYYRLGKFNLKCHISQKGARGKRLLTEIMEFLAERAVKSSLQLRKDTDYYILWLCGRENVIRFLSGMLGYLRIKKLEAQDLLRFFRIYPSIQGKLLAESNEFWRYRKNVTSRA